MEVVANTMVVIILQFIKVSSQLDALNLNLHNVMCQLHLNKAGGKKVKVTWKPSIER